MRAITVLAACAITLTGGCATVSIMDAPADVAARRSPAQAELRAALDRLADEYAAAKWAPADASQIAARRALAVLMKGAKAGEEASEDPVAKYVAGLVSQAGVGGAPEARLVDDLSRARSLAAGVNEAARALAEAPAPAEPATLLFDIRRIEEAMAVTRRARALFSDAAARLQAAQGEAALAPAREALAAFEAEIAAMSARADAINARRLALGGPAIG